ncbi:MAG TPA: DUF1080 domain-containing protein [Pirellulales bacterium]
MQFDWRRKVLFVVIICTCFANTCRAAEENRLTPQELDQGWIQLFDGETLFGWTAGSDADWKAHDGVISSSTGKQGLLCTNTEFANYELKVDFKCPAETDSGVFLRSLLVWKVITRDCYELNIAPTSNQWSTGALVGRQKANGAEPKDDQWNMFDIVADGAHCTVKLNDKLVCDYTDAKPISRGFIGLQHNKGPVEFRNIKLRPLGLKSIYSGKDLAGWKPPEGNKSEFAITPEGWLHLQQGKGALESDHKFGDFVLQLESKTGGKNLNSGVFFRSIPGELLNGYECQIHNGFKNDDRTQPVDGGTGAIYRRQAVRKVVPNDQEWFHLTLIATGKHMASWVDGYQVTDVVDERAADDNPRNGSRTAAGTFQLQGHDKNTDVMFRNLQVVELPAKPE